jgi:hypothetical protein
MLIKFCAQVPHQVVEVKKFQDRKNLCLSRQAAVVEAATLHSEI